MPVARYFLFVGGALLALLFGINAFAPASPVAEKVATVASTPTEHPVLRIRSDHKWPEPVVYDTSLPTIVPATIVAAEVAPVVPPVTVAAAKARGRESFAQVVTPETTKPDPKPELKPQPKRKVARSHATQPMMMVAQQPRSTGLFGNNIW